MCSAMAFQNVPHKAPDSILYHVIVSAISRKANLSHYAVLDKCEKLINAGLMESARTNRNRLFKITEKGLGFIQEFQKFQSLIESMNLRY